MNGNPLAGDVPPQLVARALRNTSKLAGMLQQEHPGWGETPASMFADVVNVHRADLKRMADVVDATDPQTGEPLEIGMMTEEKAAALLAGVVDGEGVKLLEVFNEMARKRDVVLREMLTEEQYQEFMQQKTAAMLTEDPETWDGETEG